MEIFDDGHAAIGVEADGGIFRILACVPSDDDPRPPYVTVGSWSRISDDIIKFFAFAGTGMNVRHIRLILRWALNQGYRLAYLDRLPGHGFPTAEVIQDGDFKGWWRLDLVSTRLLNKRGPAGPFSLAEA